jgi:excisionase family DNA binding protein
MPRLTDGAFVRRPAGRDPFAGLLTVSEAAALTGHSIQGLHYCIKRGILPAWHRGALFLLPRDEVERWHAARTTEKQRREAGQS